METKITQWGNSLAVRVPKDMALSLGFKNHQHVLIQQKGKGILIEPIEKKLKKLEDLIAQIKPEHLHKEEDWGKPEGNEVW